MTLKSALAAAGLLAVAFLLFGPAPEAVAKSDKIWICHVPPGNPENAHPVWVSIHSWEPGGRGHNPHQAHAMDFVCQAEGCVDECPPVDDGEEPPEGPMD